mmetsp:Transcript_53825/g.149690  ORF Transcript_53825/g.149690 Transcript_53825/m.149690 type:complete len:207 (+) Transcript_53825:1709-2329(+)
MVRVVEAIEAPTANGRAVNHQLRPLFGSAERVAASLKKIGLLETEVKIVVLATPAFVRIGETIGYPPMPRAQRDNAPDIVRIWDGPAPAFDLPGDLIRPDAPAIVHDGFWQDVDVVHDDTIKRPPNSLGVVHRQAKANVEKVSAVEECVVELLDHKDHPPVLHALSDPSVDVGLDTLTKAFEMNTAVPHGHDQRDRLRRVAIVSSC